MNKQTVFVGGSMRSGTTMLYGLVCSSPQVNDLVAECQYFTEQVANYRRWVSYGPNTNFINNYFGDMQTYKAFSREKATELLDLFRARLAPGKVMALKSPQLTKNFWQVEELVPDARYIVSVRDPRDVIASILVTADKIRNWDGGQNHFFRFLCDWGRDMEKFSEFFMSYYRPVMKLENHMGKRLLFMKYETVVQDIGGAVKQLADLLGIEPWEFDNTKPWYPDKNQPPRKMDASNWTTDRYFETISDKSVGNFRSAFSGEELAVIERVCGDYMKRFGYQPVA